MSYLFVDPGKSTGWATFNDMALPTGRGICKGVEAWNEWLKDKEPFKIVGYEEYQLFAHKAIAQVGSKMDTSQAIGVLKVYTAKWDSQVVPQRPQCWKLGCMYSGEKVPKGHPPDDKAAYWHGIYYLTKHGLINSVLTKNKIIVRPPRD